MGGAFGRIGGALLVAGFVNCTIAPEAKAQGYPNRQITVIVPFAAGGIADVIGRLIGQKLNEQLGQSVVIEDRAGGAGFIGTRAVASAAPDGYTILSTTTAIAIAETASSNRGYKASDLRAVAIVAISPDLLSVHPSNPVKDLKEFVDSARKKSFTYPVRASAPRRISAQSISSGTSPRSKPCTCLSTAAHLRPRLLSAIMSTRWC